MLYFLLMFFMFEYLAKINFHWVQIFSYKKKIQNVIRALNDIRVSANCPFKLLNFQNEVTQ